MVDLCSEILQTVEESVYVGLPGAGGDDAIFLIYETNPNIEDSEILETIQA